MDMQGLAWELRHHILPNLSLSLSLSLSISSIHMEVITLLSLSSRHPSLHLLGPTTRTPALNPSAARLSKAEPSRVTAPELPSRAASPPLVPSRLNVGDSQTISGSTSQHGEYKGHGIGARSQGYPAGAGGPTTPLPVPVLSESPVEPVPAPAATQAPWWLNQYYYYNYGTSRIEGNTKQDGTFKGHGTGASIIQGGFTATGDIK